MTIATGVMTNPQKIKASSMTKPSETVAMCDVSGSNDPAFVNGVADAAWIDTVWAARSGPGFAANSQFNGRIQTAYAKHNGRVNIIYADGHAAPSYPSALYWGQFYGVFQSGITLLNYDHNPLQWNGPISQTAYDSLQWSTTPRIKDIATKKHKNHNLTLSLLCFFVAMLLFISLRPPKSFRSAAVVPRGPRRLISIFLKPAASSQ